MNLVIIIIMTWQIKRDQADFRPATAEYLRAHGSLAAAQTPASWGAFVIVYVEERLEHHVEANAAARKDRRDGELASAHQAFVA